MPKLSPDLEIKHALWFRGDLSFKLQSHQLDIYKKIKEKSLEPQNVFVLLASRRLGKSYLLAILAIEKALSQPGMIIKFCASSAKQVREFISPMLADICQDAPKSVKPSLVKAELTFTFRNGSKIQLSGLDENRVENIRGAKCDLAIVDEAAFVTDLNYAVKSVIFPMTLTTKGQIILSSNSPLSPSHEFVQVFCPEAIATDSFLKRTIEDNSTLTREDVNRVAKQYGGYKNTDFRREFMCEFVVDQNSSIIPEFFDSKNEIVVPDSAVKLPAFYSPIVTIDLGFNDSTAVCFGYYDFVAAKTVVQAELLLNKVNSKQLVERCLAVEVQLWGDKTPIRYADGQLYSLNDINTVHGYSVGTLKKDVLEAQVNSLRLDIQSRKLVISDKCVNLIHQLETGTWSKDKSKFARSGSNHQDLLISLIYLVRHISKMNPYPRDYQYDPSTQWRKKDKLDSNASKIKNLFNISKRFG